MNRTLYLLFIALILFPAASLHAQSPLTLKVNLLGVPNRDIIVEADYQFAPRVSAVVGIGVRDGHVDLRSFRFFRRQDVCQDLGVGLYVGGRFLVNEGGQGLAIKPIITYQRLGLDEVECGLAYPSGFTFFNQIVMGDLMLSYTYAITPQVMLEASLGLGLSVAQDNQRNPWVMGTGRVPAQLSLGYFFGD